MALPPTGFKVIPLGQDLKDFGDTAALLMNLDLLISVDTSVVHLAGALARPVWTIVARGPDWRWMLEREDTPWYPTMRLFRQQHLKQWGPVLQRIRDQLRTFVKERLT
jgi:ADP-heptose:LPS heptosyltransferase